MCFELYESALACWNAVGAERGALEGLELSDADTWLGGPLPVDGLAVGASAAALLSAADLAEARGARRPAVGLSAEHVALSFQSERHALERGVPIRAGFAPLSRLVRCAHGEWARTHANYPHHAAALGRALEIDVTSGPSSVEQLETAAGALDALALEEAVFAAGGCATALRSPDCWAQHPAGLAAAGSSLIARAEALAVRAPRGLAPLRRGEHPPAARPAAGLRVLDLTRVIAGPVAGRTLAALGAQVLRIDPPALPELRAQHLDTGPGKRAANLDLADAERREALLAGADVLLCGYRPGALERFDLQPERLAERHPQLVQVSLSAWGAEGPWAQRRGFDSLVQVASGIAVVCAEASTDATPGVLPAQALDHATGHLMAAAALEGLTARALGEPIMPARLSLARTAQALLSASRPASVRTDATGTADPRRHRVCFGDLSLIAPPGTLDGVALGWTHGPRPLGADAGAWW